MTTIKMMSLKKAASQIAVSLVAFAACQPDNDILNSVDVQNVNSELASAAMISENSEISAAVISGLTNTMYAGARIAADTFKNLSFKDPRLTCATDTLIRTGTTNAPAGVIIIDFGTSGTCSDSRGVTRKGKIKITYAGKRWAPGSSFTMELINFFRNGASIEGTEKLTFVSSIDTLHLMLTDTLKGGKVTFGDGKTINRDHTLTKTWYRFINSSTNQIDPLRNESHIEGSATGKTKNGNAYAMNTITPLVQKLSCWISNKVFIPVSGKKNVTITSTGETYTIDYGDGTCDNQIVVSKNEKAKTITVTADGN